jgi:predicted Zn finger-like uncharacterized protein
MIAIECPECATRMRAPEGSGGKKVKCTRCGHRFSIPVQELTDDDFEPLSTSLDAARPPELPAKPSWYYANNGERRGPVSNTEVAELVRTGLIKRETSVWTEGMADWQPAGQSKLKSLFQTTPDQPPPLVGENVQNGIVWTLALVPLLDVLTLGALPWWVFFLINTVLCVLDEWRLKKAGHTRPMLLWVILVPVYLFVRASKARQRPDYAYVWILCFVISLLVTLPIFPVH